MSAISPEMESLKTRLKAMWMAGDFGEVAKHIETGAEEFIARLALKPGVLRIRATLFAVGCMPLLCGPLTVRAIFPPLKRSED